MPASPHPLPSCTLLQQRGDAIPEPDEDAALPLLIQAALLERLPVLHYQSDQQKNTGPNPDASSSNGQGPEDQAELQGGPENDQAALQRSVEDFQSSESFGLDGYEDSPGDEGFGSHGTADITASGGVPEGLPVFQFGDSINAFSYDDVGGYSSLEYTDYFGVAELADYSRRAAVDLPSPLVSVEAASQGVQLGPGGQVMSSSEGN